MRKKFLGMLLVLFVCVSMVACSEAAPDAGHEVVVVEKPWVFGDGGIRPESVKTGRQYFAPSSEMLDVNMQPRQQQFTFDDLFTSDGVPLDFHVSVQYQITDAVKLAKDFGADDTAQGMGFFLRVLDRPFQSLVRDAVKKHGLNEMAIIVTAANEVDAEVTSRFAEVIKATGVPIRLQSVTLGRANPPDAIKHQRIATAEQEQRQNTEKQAMLAEDQRLGHEKSRAAADNGYREAMHLSPEQFVQLKQMETLKEVCSHSPCTFISGGVGTMYTIK